MAAQTAGGAVVGLGSGGEEGEAAPAAAAGAAEEKSGGGSGTEETQGSGEPEAAGPDYVLPESHIAQESDDGYAMMPPTRSRALQGRLGALEWSAAEPWWAVTRYELNCPWYQSEQGHQPQRRHCHAPQ